MLAEVTLRNGDSVPEPAVTALIIVLDALRADQAVYFYELVMLCRDRNHKLFGRSGEVLRKRELLGVDGQPHDITRSIVLSAVEGDGFNMRLRSPIESVTS